MPNATATLLAHVRRAVQFYNETDVYVGFGKSDPWSNESAPPNPDPASRNIGMVINETYTGSSLTSTTAQAKINRDLFVGGVKVYRVTALTSNTYEVREVGGAGALQGNASYAVQEAARADIIVGVDIKVNGTLTPADTYTFTVDGAVGFKKVSEKHIIAQDPDGTIVFGSEKYSIVDPALAYDNNARWVYIKTTFEYDELPATDYRQLGIFVGLVKKDGVVAEALLPSDIESTGIMVLTENRRVVYRDETTKEIVEFIVEH
jgi:hypothetical protein